MKQTALCKLIDQLITLVDRSKISDTMLQGMVEEAINEEKEQIIKAYQQGVTDEYGDTLDFTNDDEGEEYYNRIYGK